MKKIAMAGWLSLLVLAGATVAQPAEEQKKGAAPGGAMQEMMKGGQSGEGGMGGMMRMMKMMEQCAGMMEQCCAPDEPGKQKENPKP